MTINPRVGFYLSIVLACIGILASGSTQLTDIFGDHSAKIILASAMLLLSMGNAVNAVLHMIPSQSGPVAAQQFMLGPAVKP